MKSFNTIDEILDFAIQNEQNAVQFYTDLADKATMPEVKETFISFAKEEMGHKTRLQIIKDEGIFAMEAQNYTDLRISDYVVNVEAKSVMTYQESLILAMHREKAAFKMYNKLASRTTNPELMQIFQNLAQEEAKHKLRFELEYDDYIMQEN